MPDLIAIDPGPTESAYVELRGSALRSFGKIGAIDLVETLQLWVAPGTVLVIEQVRCYGLPVGSEVLDTVHLCGRYEQSWRDCGGGPVHLVPRTQVRRHHCHSMHSNDATVRQALIDRFGGKAAIRKGGPLYGVHGDVWAALAVGLCWFDSHKED